MAIKACTECGKEVSTSAKVCPNCGKTRPTGGMSTFSKIVCGTIIFAIIITIIISSSRDELLYANKGSNANSANNNVTKKPLNLPPKGKYQHNHKIVTNYNKFDDATSTTVENLKLNKNLKLDAYFIYPGKKLVTPNTVRFRFISNTNNWEYLQNRPLVLLINDATRINLNTPTHNGTVGDGYVLEFMYTDIPLETFIDIVSAKSVEGALGATEFKLNVSQIEALKDLASRMY